MADTILCKAEAARFVMAIPADTIAKQWMESFGIDVGEKFRNIEQIELWHCTETHFEWYTPEESAGTGELYSQLAEFDWYYLPEKWEFSRALEYLNPESAVLEVGSGFGGFLDIASQVGIDVSGVEISPKAHVELKKKGHKFYQQQLGELSKLGLEFDAICAFQVLEHDPRPVQLLMDMKNLVRVGGRLILSVPNADVMHCIDPKRINLMDQPPHHMSHWSERVFTALENGSSMRVIDINYEPLQDYHVHWFVISYFRSKWMLLFPGGSQLPSRLLFNRYTLFPIIGLLRLGFRKLFRGHTMLAVLERME